MQNFLLWVVEQGAGSALHVFWVIKFHVLWISPRWIQNMFRCVRDNHNVQRVQLQHVKNNGFLRGVLQICRAQRRHLSSPHLTFCILWAVFPITPLSCPPVSSSAPSDSLLSLYYLLLFTSFDCHSSLPFSLSHGIFLALQSSVLITQRPSECNIKAIHNLLDVLSAISTPPPPTPHPAAFCSSL